MNNFSHNFLSHKVQNLAESETLAMAQLTNDLKSKGVDVINLSLGEPDFQTPAFICEAAKTAIDEGHHGYTPVAGELKLRQLIAEKLKRENQIHVTAQQVVVSTGAKQCIANLLISLLNDGDEVVLPAPYWVSYKDMAQFFGAKVVEVPSRLEDDFKIDAKTLDEYLSENSKIFLFSNPCNPSGTLYSKEELESLLSVFERYPNLIIISDEIYEYIRFEDNFCSLASFPTIAQRVVTVNGLSKGFAMTGWRLGYLAAPLEIAKACSKVQSQMTSGANAPTQRAAMVALRADGWRETQTMREAFRQRRDHLIALLSAIEGVEFNCPQGAFYLFPRIDYYLGKSYKGKVLSHSKDLALYLLEEAHVGLTPGGAFGCPEHIRLSYAVEENVLTDAVQRIDRALKLLQ